MTPVKPILKPINKHLMETSDGASARRRWQPSRKALEKAG